MKSFLISKQGLVATSYCLTQNLREWPLCLFATAHTHIFSFESENDVISGQLECKH